jgi:hypothetical protein
MQNPNQRQQASQQNARAHRLDVARVFKIVPTLAEKYQVAWDRVAEGKPTTPAQDELFRELGMMNKTARAVVLNTDTPYLHARVAEELRLHPQACTKAFHAWLNGHRLSTKDHLIALAVGNMDREERDRYLGYTLRL